jgi:hypothetical protein
VTGRYRGGVSWFLTLLACRSPVIDVIPGYDTSLEVVVSNPTSCASCDPFRDVDTLKIEVTVGDDLVASDSFAYPDEPVSLPDLAGFGVVRITLLGLAGGRVISVGRTPEIVLVPDATMSVPLVFLPANRGLPLDAGMTTARLRHLALSLRDGSVLLVGGLDPLRQRVLADVERYDPTTGTFTEADPLPVAGVAEPKVATLADGAALLIGGFGIIGGNEVAVPGSVLLDEAQSTFTAAGSLSQGRAGHCVAMFRARQGIVFGGAPGPADYLKPDDTDTWSFSALEVRDLDAGRVTGCVPLSDGRVFLQGSDSGSTGIWDAADESVDPAQAFTPMVEGASGDFRYVSGPVLLPTADGDVRVFGGADVSTGEVYADGRRFAADAMRFSEVPGFRQPRFDGLAAPWILPGWYAVGCGWADAARDSGEPSVELFSPDDTEAGTVVALDRTRPGCAMSVLPDGSILVTGGYEIDGSSSVADAALIVPYLDSTTPG